MTTLGFCTNFSQADEWAFEYALHLARTNDWQLNICHWLRSPYHLRRDMVPDDLFEPRETLPVTPQLLNKLEQQLREFYDPKLGDFTNVAFKLCEGQYQVELVRCFRKYLLDAVVMGYQPQVHEQEPGAQSLEDFAQKLSYPLIIVGRDGANSLLINLKAQDWLMHRNIPIDTYEVLEAVEASIAASNT